MVIERVKKTPMYGAGEQLIVPQIVYSDKEKEEVQAITYTMNGIKYQLSNKDGHKVGYISSIAAPRPMTKKEFKDLCSLMVLNASQYGDLEETILAEIEKLDFAAGHANSTFEIVRSCVETRKVGTLVLNLGTARYLYNQDADTVFHIDHSKLINGHMLCSPEKEEIISKINSSKTMSKKIQRALNS